MASKVDTETPAGDKDIEMVMVEVAGSSAERPADVPRRERRRPFKRSPPPPPPESLDDAPEIPLATANIISRLTFQWLTPLMRLGYKRPIQSTDLWKMDISRQALELSEKFMANYDKRQQRAAEWNRHLATVTPPWTRRAAWTIKAATSRHLPSDYAAFGADDSYAARRATLETEWRVRDGLKAASLGWALFDTFPAIRYAGVWRFLCDGGNLAMPILVKSIIRFAQEVAAADDGSGKPPSTGKGVGLAFGIFALILFIQTCLQQSFFVGESSGVLFRATLIQATYKRAFQLSASSRAKNPDGKLMAHLSADVSRVDAVAKQLHCIWTAPISLVLVLILLCCQIGPSGLVGFMFFVALMPIQGWLLKIGLKLRGKLVEFTEARSKLLQGLLPSMSIIKMFTYEVPYLERLGRLRKTEMSYLRSLLFSRAANQAIAISSPSIASVFAFVMYSSLHPTFDPAIIFASLMYFNMLRPPLVLIPQALSMAADAQNALDRMSTLFQAEVKEDPIVINPELDVAVRCTNASFQWVSTEKSDPSGNSKDGNKGKKAKRSLDTVAPDPETHEPFTIRDLDLEIPRGQLVAIVGPVGSGKSSLLQALLGEMRSVGTVEFGGRLGYCQQSAWIQNATVRDNIVFGQPWDETKYWRCLREASLIRDLEILADGDMTEIGERGINLSGGQKQRLNIARALYYDADIILLDDPLSAVDAHVGKALFNDAILGPKRAGKTVLLVTHALHFLPQVDYIYALEDGHVVEEGTYPELMAYGSSFRALMDEFGGGEEEKQQPEGGEVEAEVVADVVDVAPEGELGTAKALEVMEAPIETGEAAGSGKEEGRLMLAEKRKTGAVGFRTYAAYFLAGGAIWMILSIVLLIVTQGATVMGTVWLTYWQEDKFHMPTSSYQGIYGVFGVATAVLEMSAAMAMTTMSIRASVNLHDRVLRHVWFSPMSFFDTQPLGRLMGVFTKDMDAMDNELSEILWLLLLLSANLLGAIVITAVHFPYYLAIVFVIGCGYMYLTYYYRKTSREVKRLDSQFRSTLYAHFAESLNGLATIRAYGEEQRFIRENASRIDLQDRAYPLTKANQVWLDMRFGYLGAVLVLAIALLCALGAKTVGAATVGMIMTYMNMTTSSLSLVGALIADVENAMNSVERVLHYSGSDVPQEAPYEIEGTRPKGAWPSTGAIKLDNVVMSYRTGLPAVLKGVSVNISPGQRVGIIGRTGAGKTSITVALYRLCEATSGTISIDNVDISTQGLEALRSSIAIIPQDPVLFNGTLRSNLDPFDRCTDVQLYDALERACLRTYRATDRAPADDMEAGEDLRQRFTLDMAIDDGGANLSVGQRALVSLARALVKNARIMVLDEATASVDLETDAKIQAVIRSEHAASRQTLLCIAHRLRTVIGWDRILVMDAGTVAGFASPLELFDGQSDGGLFRSMCERSNIGRDEILHATIENRVE